MFAPAKRYGLPSSTSRMPSRRTKSVLEPCEGTWVGLAALTPAQPVSAAPPSATLVASIVRLLIFVISVALTYEPGKLGAIQSLLGRTARLSASDPRRAGLFCNLHAIGAWFGVLVRVQAGNAHRIA